jgi:hypothetical protein
MSGERNRRPCLRIRRRDRCDLSLLFRTGRLLPEGFTFTNGQLRGCVPLDVTIGRDPRVRHVTLSLFAGRCPA